jgi:hypothetical protein
MSTVELTTDLWGDIIVREAAQHLSIQRPGCDRRGLAWLAWAACWGLLAGVYSQ